MLVSWGIVFYPLRRILTGFFVRIRWICYLVINCSSFLLTTGFLSFGWETWSHYQTVGHLREVWQCFCFQCCFLQHYCECTKPSMTLIFVELYDWLNPEWSKHIFLVSSVIGGFLSDRLGRRKPLVVGSGTVHWRTFLLCHSSSPLFLLIVFRAIQQHYLE